MGVLYLIMIRPQKKQQKEMDALRDSVKPGDNIMTTGGFYGVVLDVVDDTVIVEFGNNKNCRIPMHKNAIAEVEKEEAEEKNEGK
ncbi:MAG: preprotein translocase subunit YajC [Lachnospiraceae bacterium]|nr:preprotein translocase subunit YajC [Lachnospiraceae bacterium]